MSRIAATFARLQAAKRKALIPYVTAGDPYPDATVDVMPALAAGGADIIELGVPFSDPMADGPVIQKASERALAHGIGLAQVLDVVRTFRRNDNSTPVVLMGYANPVERYDQLHGDGAFIAAASQAGVDGVLIVDYPPEECAAFARNLQAAGIDMIFLLAPTSSETRMRQVGEVATGYVYYVSLKGVTGAGHLDVSAVADAVPRIRKHVRVPVGVGFGIRDAATAQAIGRVCDGVVVGSKLVQVLEACPRDGVAAAARSFATDLRNALDALPA